MKYLPYFFLCVYSMQVFILRFINQSFKSNPEKHVQQDNDFKLSRCQGTAWPCANRVAFEFGKNLNVTVSLACGKVGEVKSPSWLYYSGGPCTRFANPLHFLIHIMVQGGCWSAEGSSICLSRDTQVYLLGTECPLEWMSRDIPPPATSYHILDPHRNFFH